MRLEVRPARPEDNVAMAELEGRVSSNPWTAQQYVESIENHACWLLADEQRLVGLLIYSQVFDEVELLNVVVDRQFQGQGYGKRLLQLLVDETRGKAQKIFLEVRESNIAAIGLYRHFKFNNMGMRKDYYPANGGRENALIMCYEYA